MARGSINVTALDDYGNIQPFAMVEVRRSSDNVLVTLYDAVTGGSSIANPFACDADGVGLAFADSEQYDITVTAHGNSKTYTSVAVRGGAPSSVTDGAIDDFLNDRNVYLTGSNVGIGATSPLRTLHVASTTPTFILEDTDNGADLRKRFLSIGSSGSMIFGKFTDAMASSIHMAIMNDGKVAISTLSPSTQLHVNGPIRHLTYTVATLPAAGTVGAGTRAAVTDANATTFNSIVAAGGANFVPVISNGANWLIG